MVLTTAMAAALDAGVHKQGCDVWMLNSGEFAFLLNTVSRWADGRRVATVERDGPYLFDT